ncbi:MAG: insulinase family protein [Candidatus Aminicenantes bacterium]|nr:insulinase family protein [Candidatus Aminicenantes bacterium]
MKVKYFFVICFFLFNSLNNHGQNNKIDSLQTSILKLNEFPKIDEKTTNNGIKLRLIQTGQIPIIQIDILMKGGDYYDSFLKPGLAKLAIQLLRTSGTKDKTSSQFNMMLDSMGISLSLSTRMDYINISLSCLKENIEDSIALLADLLQFPSMEKTNFTNTKKSIDSSLFKQGSDPEMLCKLEFQKLIYGVDLSLSNNKIENDIERISLEDVIDFYDRFIAPDNMLVGITGPIDMNSLYPLFEKYLGNWNKKAKIPKLPNIEDLSFDFKVAFIEKENLTQSQIIIGHLGIKVENLSDQAKIMIFNQIFSESPFGYLYNQIRNKKGLAYMIKGGIWSSPGYWGITSFWTATKSESTIQTIKIIFNEMELIQNKKISEKELQMVKKYLLNSYVVKNASFQKMLFDYLFLEHHNYKMANYSKTLLEKIEMVTANDVFEVANRFLNPNKMIVLIVGDEKKINGKLEEIGKVKYLKYFN